MYFCITYLLMPPHLHSLLDTNLVMHSVHGDAYMHLHCAIGVSLISIYNQPRTIPAEQTVPRVATRQHGRNAQRVPGSLPPPPGFWPPFLLVTGL
jgi:hypothetical protein